MEQESDVMGKIVLIRSAALTDKLRAYKVLVDQRVVGKIRDGATQSFDCAPGRHRLSLKLDWGGSSSLEFDLLSENDSVEFECHPSAIGWQFLVVLRCFFAPNQWIVLKRKV